MLAHLLIRRLRELIIVILVVKVPVKARLEREAIHDAKLAPQDDTSGFEFGLLKAETARVVAELAGLLRDQLGNDAHPEVLVRMQWLLRSVNENVFLS